MSGMSGGLGEDDPEVSTDFDFFLKRIRSLNREARLRFFFAGVAGREEGSVSLPTTDTGITSPLRISQLADSR